MKQKIFTNCFLIKKENGAIIKVCLAMKKKGIINFTLRIEDKNVQMHAFLVYEWEREPVETEEMKPQWFKIQDVPYNQMWKSDSEWLPMMLDGKKFLATYTYEREGGKVEEREIKEIENF